MTNKGHIFNCIKQNNLRQVTLLLQGGCDVNITNASGRTPLIASLVHIYDTQARLRVMRQLIKAKADVNKTDTKRKSPLTYACALNQPESVKLLLEQKAINPNLPDNDGVTPLMVASSLGHTDVIKIMMEYNRSGSVTIDMNSKDNQGQTALDHANNNNDNNTASNNNNNSNVAVQELLKSYSDDVGAVRSSSPIGQGEDIELVDMDKAKNSTSTAPSRQPVDHTAKKDPVSAVPESDKDRDSSIRRWAVDVKQQHEDAGRLSTLASQSTTSLSRPGSKKGQSKNIPLNERSPSSLSVKGGPKRPVSSQGKFSSRSSSRAGQLTSSGEDDEDEDFSLESLSDLLGTVRQYAKEIHEIYAPIQKDEEERIRKRNERNARRKSKDLATKARKQLTPPGPQEVRVDIHKIEESILQKVQGRPRGRSKPEGPSHSKSHEPIPTEPVASLHVENEQLSSTWPRGRSRPHSHERFWSESRIDKNRAKTMHTSSSSTTFARPQIPADWNDANSLQHEREILTKAFQRFQKPSPNPLLGPFNKKPANAQMQKQGNPNQGVTPLGKSYPQVKQNPLPSISIIPPPAESQAGSWEKTSGILPSAPPYSERPETPLSPSPAVESSHDVMMPAGHVISDEAASIHPGRQSKNGGAGVKSSSKTGLRRRKSVDQGLGHPQPASIQKY